MIKNRNSVVAVEKSVAKIEKAIISMGGTHIAKEYDGFGKVSAIMFSVKIPGKDGLIFFKLPSRVDALTQHFLKEYRRPTEMQKTNAEEQAQRTAWKNVLEWTELQATMIKLDQMEFMQAFMPYIYSMSDRKTLFERAKENNFKQLTN